MRERDVKKKILDLFRESGFYAEKMHGSAFMAVGLPDILACVDGTFVAIETKAPGRGSKGDMSATAQQRFHLQAIRKAGGKAAVIDDHFVIKEMLYLWPDVCDTCLKWASDGKRCKPCRSLVA